MTREHKYTTGITSSESEYTTARSVRQEGPDDNYLKPIYTGNWRFYNRGWGAEVGGREKFLLRQELVGTQ